MLSWLGGIAALTISLGVPDGAAGGRPIDCGLAPTVKCLAAAVFALAKTLPDDSYFRKHVGFAEQELAPADIKVALDYVAADAPDAPPWEDIDWIAKAGRIDRAIELAKQGASPVERLGGLLAVASYLLDKNDTARANKIVDEVERELPLVSTDDNDQDASSLAGSTGEIRARLGQTERAARLIGSSGESVSSLLSIAGKYPVAASLREHAWRIAEHVNEPYVWTLVVEDAISRNDQADVVRAGERATSGLDGVVDPGHSDSAISLAGVLLTAGLPQLSAKLVKPWVQWINGKDDINRANTVNNLIPILASLGRDQDVETATRTVGDVFHRTGCLSKAAAEYFRIGRSDVAIKFDREALFVAAASPTGEPKLQSEHDSALHNLALARAGHGDIQGALDAIAKLGDESKKREVEAYVVRNAIDGGYGPVVGPAIEALVQDARKAQDAGLLLQAANGWYEVGNEEEARRSLDEAMKLIAGRQPPLAANDVGRAAELMWRINGKGEAKAMLAIANQLEVSDPGSVDHLVEVMKPVSPAVAVQLTGRQTEVERQIDELANIGIAIAQSTK